MELLKVELIIGFILLFDMIYETQRKNECLVTHYLNFQNLLELAAISLTTFQFQYVFFRILAG